MARFKRLTDAEARTLTRAELLDRLEAEQAYWFRKKIRTDEDQAASREFSRILLAHVDPAAAIQAARDVRAAAGAVAAVRRAECGGGGQPQDRRAVLSGTRR